MSRVAVIGAGVMGMACAMELLKKGHQVEIFEADDRVGGMSAHFDFNGLSIERYYHFICKPDTPYFELLQELDLLHILRWQPTYMGYFFRGRLHDWGNPVALLKFSGLGLFDRLRYGAHMFFASKRRRWDDLDRVEAGEWIRKWIGPRAYDVLWRPLFQLKFHHHSDNLSAAWIWTRIKRVGSSRRSLMQEELGYLEGGSESLLTAMENRIRELGGQIHLSTPVERVVLATGRVAGITVGGETQSFDTVISTTPLPFVPKLIPDLDEQTRRQYEAIDNIAVACVIFKLARPVTRNFWLNVSDPEMDIPGIIEYTNLRNMDEHIVYVPYYMPAEHEKYQWDDKRLIDEAAGYLRRINPELDDADFLDACASRYRFAQPICPPGFLEKLPPIKTRVEGLYIADTSYYYPEDRSISESVRVGREIAAMIDE
ncbi:MAG TPA: NAD(P)/FAD-dependent oxidoreductase [Gammaproteobacteria bacterium]|nr:NAD(P)/FAD-dependent oxidoreductase [Gammaproteobacteria bacterium]